MLVKFLKPYSIFKVGETTDMLRNKAADLKAQGIITDDPVAIRKKNTKVVPSQKDEAVK